MASAVPPPPTITVDAPGATPAAPTPALSSTTQGAPANTSPVKVRPQMPTLVKSCYLCDEQNPGDFSPTTKFLETCLLCSRFFCPIHKSEQWDTVCNINHSQYYKECLAKARAELQSQGKDPDSEGRRSVAELLINEGIYPSLGEREKAIFSTSPVDDKTVQDLETYRSLDAALAGSSTKTKAQLIEERDVLEADIAV